MRPNRLESVSEIKLAIEAIWEDGAVIIPDAFPPAMIDRLVRDFSTFGDEIPIGTNAEDPFQAEFYGSGTKRFTGLVGKVRSFEDIILNEMLLSIADEFLLPLCGEYMVNTAEMIEVNAGAKAQYVHRDNENWPEAAGLGELMVATIVALVDFTAENGATRVVPGSHRWQRERRPSDAELVPAAMTKGSALVYLGSALHGAGANATADTLRRSFHLSYCLGWLRTEENHYVAMPFDKVPDLQARTRQLLGFTSYKPKVMPGGMLGLKDCEDITPLFAPPETPFN